MLILLSTATKENLVVEWLFLVCHFATTKAVLRHLDGKNRQLSSAPGQIRKSSCPWMSEPCGFNPGEWGGSETYIDPLTKKCIYLVPSCVEY